MPGSGTTVNCFDAVAAKMRGMSRKMAERYMEPILQDAAAPVVRATKGAIAPHDRTGALERSIGVAVRIYPRKMRFTAIIGARRGFSFTTERGQRVDPTHYHHLLEFGTGPHIEQWTDMGGKRKQYVHHGAAPYPTLRPAWDEQKGAAYESLRNGLQSCIRDLATDSADPRDRELVRI